MFAIKNHAFHHRIGKGLQCRDFKPVLGSDPDQFSRRFLRLENVKAVTDFLDGKTAGFEFFAVGLQVSREVFLFPFQIGLRTHHHDDLPQCHLFLPACLSGLGNQPHDVVVVYESGSEQHQLKLQLFHIGIFVITLALFTPQ